MCKHIDTLVRRDSLQQIVTSRSSSNKFREKLSVLVSPSLILEAFLAQYSTTFCVSESVSDVA